MIHVYGGCAVHKVATSVCVAPFVVVHDIYTNIQIANVFVHTIYKIANNNERKLEVRCYHISIYGRTALLQHSYRLQNVFRHE